MKNAALTSLHDCKRLDANNCSRSSAVSGNNGVVVRTIHLNKNQYWNQKGKESKLENK